MASEKNKYIVENLLEVATRLGKLESAIESQGKSIDALFKLTRETTGTIIKMQTKTIPNLKISLSTLNFKMASIIASLGLIGGFIANFFLTFFKKLPWVK
jgi:hypothetical protein